MIEIKRYTCQDKNNWDEFVSNSKNFSFLFFRDYMEYHNDRFKDFSVMIYHKSKLIALLPANIKENTVYSHQGLTFGGFITDEKMKQSLMIEIFSSIKEFLKSKKISYLIYKNIPYIYHSYSAQEDLYVLFRNKADLYRVDCSSVIDYSNQIKYKKTNKQYISSKFDDFVYQESNDFEIFFYHLKKELKRKYDTKPVHSLDEILYLKKLFPNYIKLFIVTDKQDNFLAGIIIFIYPLLVKTQYVISIKKDNYCLICLHHYLINKYSDKKYFEFGISNEDEGNFLNDGLISFKEGFGARSIIYNHYKLKI